MWKRMPYAGKRGFDWEKPQDKEHQACELQQNPCERKCHSSSKCPGHNCIEKSNAMNKNTAMTKTIVSRCSNQNQHIDRLLYENSVQEIIWTFKSGVEGVHKP
jgi:hypothetical protein